MSAQEGLKTHQMAFSVRLIQGYRYLDRCGEALIRLEDALDKGWITGEATPRGGTIKNDTLGMTAAFNAESLSVQQTEFVSFDHFRDQACKVYEVIWKTFEVSRINAPSAAVSLQKGFQLEDMPEATKWLKSLRLCEVRTDLIQLLGGLQDALDITLVTLSMRLWDGQAVEQRRRMVASVIRQEKQAPFDERLFRRVKTLPARQQDAMQGLIRLRRQLPESAPVAAQFELESAFESEFDSRTFDLPGFLEETWEWSQRVATEIPRFGRSD